MSIVLNRPNIGPREQEACRRVLASAVLVQGPECEAFEDEFASRVGARHAIAVSSGTAALFLTIRALGLGPDDEVIIPDYTFIATANVVSLAGARLVLADVHGHTMNLDARSASKVVSERTSLIVPVHQYGLGADLSALGEIAPDVPILEDAACALGAGAEHGKIGGGPGIAACFSFHPRKVITTGEGGMITTNDDLLAARIRALRQHGQGPVGTMEPGYNLRMNEISAALGRVQLSRLDEFIEARNKVAKWYEDGLGNLDWIDLPIATPGRIYQSYVLQIHADAPVSRDEFVAGLRRADIQCQAGIEPVHRHAPYRDVPRASLGVSEALAKSALFLPMYCGLRHDEVERICSTIARIAGT